MKKGLIILLTFAGLAVGAVYIFIPSEIKVTAVSSIALSSRAAYRNLAEESNWGKWWPGERAFQYKRQTYRITKKMFDAFELTISLKNDSLRTILQLIPVNTDSVDFSWDCKLTAGNNPVERIRQYRNALSVKKNMDTLLSRMNSFLEKEDNIYGFMVKKVKVADSVLISTRRSFDHYPDAMEVEDMIQKLRTYIGTQKATEKNYPMLNVLQVSQTDYEAMVAIATDRELAATKDFAPKEVFKGGKLLEAEIKGGPFTIRKAMSEFENYKEDYQYSSPAIPYQLLVTDRMKETDTTKWVTRLYYPVF